jgi:hypothetical protein
MGYVLLLLLLFLIYFWSVSSELWRERERGEGERGQNKIAPEQQIGFLRCI